MAQTADAASQECEPHTPMPRGYLARSEWADEMMETHTPRQCKGCGLWLIWEPKTEHGRPLTRRPRTGDEQEWGAWDL